LLAVVYVNWSVLAGQTLGQWGPKFLGSLIVPEAWNFKYCPAGSVSEFVFFSGGGFTFLSFLWIFKLYIYMYRGGYIVVK
jgi:hypothetical protein